MEIYNWCVNNWDDVVTVITMTIGVASIIVRLTPQLEDDAALKSIIRFIGRFIALNR
jgi:hypothetical protein